MSTTTFWMPQVHRWINANDRMHWAEKARLTKAWRNAGLVYARRERLPHLERAQITIYVHKTTARRFDPHNLVLTGKALIDGMVDYGLLKDDSLAYLDGLDMRAGEKRAEPGLTITIKALETP